MTKAEFLKRLKEEKLHYPEREITVDKGIINGAKQFGCSFMFGKYYIFESDADHPDDRGNITPKYLEHVNKKGKIERTPLPPDVVISSPFETEEEAFEEFYKEIKYEMRTPEEIEADHQKWLNEYWGNPERYKKIDDEEDK